MRTRLLLGRSLFFAGCFLFALAALFPLRVAASWLGLDETGLAAREAKGSIWAGALSDARLGPAALGDLHAELNSLPLLLGRARLSLRGDGFDGAAAASGGGFGFHDFTGLVPLGAAFAPLPIASLHFEDVSVRFEEGACAEAEGRVQANLAGDVAGMPLPGGFGGTAQCENGALLLPMTGQSGMERIELRLLGDGSWRADLAVSPADDMIRDRLLAAGFRPGAGGYALSAEGSFAPDS